MLKTPQYKQVRELEQRIRSVIDCLDTLDDDTYELVNDTVPPSRYEDLVDWLQYISSVR